MAIRSALETNTIVIMNVFGDAFARVNPQKVEEMSVGGLFQADKLWVVNNALYIANPKDPEATNSDDSKTPSQVFAEASEQAKNVFNSFEQKGFEYVDDFQKIFHKMAKILKDPDQIMDYGLSEHHDYGRFIDVCNRLSEETESRLRVTPDILKSAMAKQAHESDWNPKYKK